MSTQEYYFGYLPDPPDARDFKLKAPALVSLPSSVDLRSFLQPIRSQGKLASCTAFATVALIECVRNKQELLQWDGSPLFTYYSTRKIEDNVNADSGAYARNALKSVIKDGVAKEVTWPYVVDNFTINPPASAWEEAEKHQALVYYRVEQTKENILQCLADGYPFIFGAQLYDSFMKTQTTWLVENVVPMPDTKKEKLLGGHCMLAVGYLSSSNESITLMVRNSWGQLAGLGGYHNMPLEYFLDPALSSDFWTVRSVERTEEDPLPKPIVPPIPEPTPEPTPEPILAPTPKPEPVPSFESEKESIWKNPNTYFIIGFVLLVILFLLF
jgi:C1A family cysteine protease